MNWEQEVNWAQKGNRHLLVLISYRHPVNAPPCGNRLGLTCGNEVIPGIVNWVSATGNRVPPVTDGLSADMHKLLYYLHYYRYIYVYIHSVCVAVAVAVSVSVVAP